MNNIENIINQDSVGENTDTILTLIITERYRQKELYDNSRDLKHTPTQWVYIISYYLFGFGYKQISKTLFKNSLIKAAAVIVAALENIDNMEKNNWLVDK